MPMTVAPGRAARAPGSVFAFADRHSGKLLLLGLVGVVLYNGRTWQRDKALLAQTARPEPLPALEAWPALPKTSVLVAAWNEAHDIEDHIASFRRLRYPHKELVLCAGGTDETYSIAASQAGDDVVVIEQRPREGKQRALARGLRQATGEVVFLTDADCELADEAFERTLWPVAWGLEVACTGSSQPGLGQMHDPFVVAQAAPQLYGGLRAPAYAPGLLGRNCAISREILQRSGALEAPAATGTDYVQAKMLTGVGARIRQAPQSRVVTEYPTRAAPYVRQQRRWLRNVFLHGRTYGAADEVRASLRTSMIGLAMLAAPFLVPLAGGAALVPWLTLFWHGLLSRLRYLLAASALLGFPVRWKHIAILPLTLVLDFVAWASPLLDYVRPAGRDRW